MRLTDYSRELAGEKVSLQPLMHGDIAALTALGNDPRIWAYLPLDGTNAEVLRRELQTAILQRTAGHHLPFTIREGEGGRIIGSTRIFDYYAEHRKAEIGWTWYHPDYWGKGLNTACKLLLLQHCFGEMKLQRVQLKTRAVNLRSRAAIEKIGATFEGTLRKDRILPNGETHDTVVYSILDNEWPVIKNRLEALGRA